MLLVDTSVWSLALRRRHPVDSPHVVRFREALTAGEVVLPGIVMQELLQNLSDGRIKDGIVAELGKLPLLVPNRSDHRQAAELYTTCRTRGVQVGTVDALIAGLCLRRDLGLLSTDRDFEYMAGFTELKLWRPDTVDQPE
jgi:predicted nucleic acid-binding protein